MRIPVARSAITLLELLLVISLIGVLLSLAIPAVQQVRATAARSACQDNLRQIALALHAHESLAGAAARMPPLGSDARWTFNQAMSWFTQILPQLDYGYVRQSAVEAFAITDQLQMDPPHTAQHIVISPFWCRADGRLSVPLTDAQGVSATFTSYVGIEGTLVGMGESIRYDGAMTQNGLAVPFVNIVDGTSQTLLVGERPPDDGLRAGWWYRFHPPPVWGPDIVMFTEELNSIWDPGCRQTGFFDGNPNFHFGPGRTSNPCDRFHFWSLHPGGANFAFADGSVRFLPYSAADILPALGTRNGGEVVALPE